MKTLKLLPLLIFILLACDQKEAPQEDNKFVVITEEVIEKYDSVLTDTEYIHYEYANEGDFFWQKKVVKDTAGAVIKTIEREFDEQGLPVREVVTDELGTQIDKAVLQYDPVTKQLVKRDEYEGEITDANKVRTIIYHYDDEGYLIKEEIKDYADADDFENVNGTKVEEHYVLRFLPQKQSRPKGLHETVYMIEKRIAYVTPELKEDMGGEVGDVGEIYLESKTMFDENGLPLTYESTHGDDHDASLEFYDVEKDEAGRIVSITSYLNESLDSASFANNKWIFEYTDDGMFKGYEEYKYNDSTEVFDLFHDARSFDWRNMDMPLKYNFTLGAECNEHFCWHRKRYSKNIETIEKFGDGEIVITHYSYGGPMDLPTRDVETDKTKVIRKKYKIVEEKDISQK